MKVLYLFLILTITSAFATGVTDPKLQVLEHDNPGCPINSSCSKEMGMLIASWIKTLGGSQKGKVKRLNAFKKKNGSPIQMLATKSIYDEVDPVLWNSRCKIHNPKNPNNTIFKGFLFINGKIEQDDAVFTPVYVYEGDQRKEYKIPYGDTVALIQNDELIVLKDFEDHFYKIAIKPDGTYRFVDLPSQTTRRALAKKIKEYRCPENISPDRRFFSKYYCQRVLDLDSNQLKTIQTAWACP